MKISFIPSPILSIETMFLIILSRCIKNSYGTNKDCVYTYDFVTSNLTKRGSFTSPGYPGNYPYQTECWYIFRANEFDGILFTFTSFNLRKPNRFGCLQDFIEFYTIGQNGLKHPVKRLCGHKHDLQELSLFTFQNFVEIRFRSFDFKPNSQFNGFNITFDIIHEDNFEPYFENLYDQDTKLLLDNYSPFRDSTTEEAPRDALVSSTVETFNVKENIFAQRNLKLLSNLTTDRAGKILPNTSESKLKVPIHRCGYYARGKTSGYIYSPGYPYNYDPLLMCLWIIRVEKYWRIYLRMEELDLEGGLSGCNIAKVLIYDGYKTLYHQNSPMTSLCGNMKYYQNEYDRSFLTDRNLAVVRFITSSEAKGINSGFKIRWTMVALNDSCQGVVCRYSQACLKSKRTQSCKKPINFCLPKSLRCNGVQECPGIDDSDEMKCYRMFMIIGLVSVPFVICIFMSVCCLARKYRTKAALKKMRDDKTLKTKMTTSSSGLASACSSKHSSSSKFLGNNHSAKTTQTKDNLISCIDSRGPEYGGKLTPDFMNGLETAGFGGQEYKNVKSVNQNLPNATITPITKVSKLLERTFRRSSSIEFSLDEATHSLRVLNGKTTVNKKRENMYETGGNSKISTNKSKKLGKSANKIPNIFGYLKNNFRKMGIRKHRDHDMPQCQGAGRIHFLTHESEYSLIPKSFSTRSQLKDIAGPSFEEFYEGPSMLGSFTCSTDTHSNSLFRDNVNMKSNTFALPGAGRLGHMLLQENNYQHYNYNASHINKNEIVGLVTSCQPGGRGNNKFEDDEGLDIVKQLKSNSHPSLENLETPEQILTTFKCATTITAAGGSQRYQQQQQQPNQSIRGIPTKV